MTGPGAARTPQGGLEHREGSRGDCANAGTSSANNSRSGTSRDFMISPPESASLKHAPRGEALSVTQRTRSVTQRLRGTPPPSMAISTAWMAHPAVIAVAADFATAS
jgi:hypothetical protein